MSSEFVNTLNAELESKTVSSSTHSTDELRFLNGILQRKFITIEKQGMMPTSTTESWENIPSVTEP